MFAEWEQQSFIQVIFPHQQSDWNCCLEEASENFLEIIYAIAKYEPCLVICDDIKRVSAYFNHTNNIYFTKLQTDDTWSRDCSAITVLKDDRLQLLDFTFNGWGNKFDAKLDNSISQALSKTKFYKNIPIKKIDFVLEGGAIESDGHGTLLTTSQCLLNPNRNPTLSKIEIENILKNNLNIKKIIWLNHGEIKGDDTDAHIDTIARFAPNDTILYVDCNTKIKQDLENENYNLIALPHIELLNQDGEHIPATYANFLIINGAVLVPTYGLKEDKVALDIIQKAFKDREIIGIDCKTLIRQHGSLHCVTMQMYHPII